VGWREQIANGYPWKPLAFVAVMLVLVIATVLATLIALPAERAVIDHGTTTTGHAVAWKDYRRYHDYTWAANVTWTDAQGHPHEQKELDISAGAAAIIGAGSDVEIRYLGDRAVIAMDVEHRVRDESNAPFVLGLFGIALLMGVYHWRRRVREWRAPKPVAW